MFRVILYTSATVCVLAMSMYWSPNAIAQIAPGVTQSAAQTASITGMVLKQDGTPVTGASLRLDGPNAHLTNVSDAHGAFIFTSVPYGTYRIDVTAANLGIATRDGIVVKGDISLAIQYEAPSSGELKTIAQVSTHSAGASINVTPASIASVSPSDYAFQGNLSWRELLNQVPGVTVGGGENGGNANAAVLMVPGSPFQPAILSINGALPYETSTTFDGMPLSNTTLVSSPGNGVDLSPFPLALFDAADVVRGPGANAPSIVDSVGGSLVLHAPGAVDRNSFEASISNDAYGGYNATSKLTYRVGKLSATIVYSLNNSPGPLGNRPGFVAINDVATINGLPLASGGLVQFYPNQYAANAYYYAQTTLLANNFPQSTEWRQHDGGIALAYQLTPKITVQAFYTGSQANQDEATAIDTYNFTPGPGYTGPLSAGNYATGPAGGGNLPLSQAGSLLEEKVTAYLGRGVLRLEALQSSTYSFQLATNTPGGTYPLYGTASYCNNPLATPPCTSTTPVAFNGSPAALTFGPGAFLCSIWSHDNDLLASYETQIGSRSNVGASYVKSAISGTNSLTLTGFSLLTNGNFTTNEFRLHASTELSEKLSLDGSYYFTQADYHIPDPSNPNQWVDSLFAYSAPRLGATWRISRDAVIRGAAGGGFALPALFNLIGASGSPICTPGVSCIVNITNINLQPEKSFGFDIGTDVRLQRNTSLSADIYRTDLYGQLFQSVKFIGIDPTYDLPTYAQEYVNLTHSRFEGINLSLNHDIPRGTYWNAGLGLTRGYIVSVPPGFYNTLGGVCNVSTGANCQNTYAVPGQNFNGAYQSTVPYANGSATLGYRWNTKKYLELEANYYGNNNAYFAPAFVEYNARAGYPLTKNLTLIATFRNITGINDNPLQIFTINPKVLAPTIAGQNFALFEIPFGPRTLVVTANVQL